MYIYYEHLYLNVIFFFFFFSSRRRHTRCSRDWSSDVCSSDLPEPGRPGQVRPASALRAPTRQGRREGPGRSEEHTSELQSRLHLVCRLLLEKKKTNTDNRDFDPSLAGPTHSGAGLQRHGHLRL